VKALPRVFLHGWGQAPSVWSWTKVATRDDDILLALPGHGGTENVAAAAWLDWLIVQLPKHPVHLVGWSLGAMLALQLAERLPQRVASLTLYAATPCFCCRSNWPHGVTSAQLEAIADSVRGDKIVRGLTLFTRMMLHGEIHDRIALRQASNRHTANLTLPTAEGLEAGISLLHTLNLRENITNIQQSVQLIHGKADAVVPIAAAIWLSRHLPNAKHHWLSAYGHMPWEKDR